LVGCKNFAPLADYAEKPEAAKCAKCRQRGRKGYLSKKEERSRSADWGEGEGDQEADTDFKSPEFNSSESEAGSPDPRHYREVCMYFVGCCERVAVIILESENFLQLTIPIIYSILLIYIYFLLSLLCARFIPGFHLMMEGYQEGLGTYHPQKTRPYFHVRAAIAIARVKAEVKIERA
jgi:hypothetical protein